MRVAPRRIYIVPVTINYRLVLEAETLIADYLAEAGKHRYIITDDVVAWHGRLATAGLPVTAVEDKSWGMREFTLTDPSSNNIRIGTSTADDPQEAP